MRPAYTCISLYLLKEDPSSSTVQRHPPWGGRIGVYLGIWLIVLAALVVQRALGSQVSWPQSIVIVIRDWFPWVILGPLLWWLVKRFPLFGERRLRNFGVHLLISMAMVVVAETMVAFVLYPATQSTMEKAALAERDQRRENRGVRRRPLVRTNEYQFRTRTMARKAPSWFLLNWVFVLIGTTVLHKRAAEEKSRRALALQRDLAHARLRELQSRLQPHFLFNALNSVSALIHSDVDKADEMLDRLSTLLRRVLVSGEKSLIPLREELGLVEDYLAIEQVRFSDRLTVVHEIDPMTLGILVPPMILQPIAENAVKHGIEPKCSPSTLQIVSEVRGGKELVLQVIDDGIGSDSGESRKGHGLGLENVRSRLENAFSEMATVSLEFPGDGGTLVEIVMPTTGEDTE